MELGLKDRTALVLACSSVIGRGIAPALVEEGAKVVICYRRKGTDSKPNHFKFDPCSCYKNFPGT